MNVQAIKKPASLRDRVSAAEWQGRLELAASYRLMDHLGMVDQAHNQVCLRCPGEPDAFLMKDPDAFFSEATASLIHKYDLNGKSRQEGVGELHGAGHFHAAIFRARPDVQATIHSHSPSNVAVSAQKFGLLPLSQHALRFMESTSYHEYNGLEGDPKLIPLIVADLSDRRICMLRNHGALVVGPTMGAVFCDHWNLEMACRNQVAALSAGRENLTMISQAAQDYALEHWRGATRVKDGGKDWRGWYRTAERLFPDFKD